MSRCSLNTEDALNRLFSENRITESIGYMRELLLLSPLNVEFRSLIMIIVMSVRTIVQGLLVVNFLCLREPSAGGLSPSVIEIEEHIIQVVVSITDALHLVEMGRNVAHFIKVFRADLTDVEIDHMAIVCVDLSQLFLSEVFGVEPVLNVHMLMRKDNGRVTVVVARSLGIKDLEVLGDLVLINLKEEVGLGLDFAVDI